MSNDFYIEISSDHSSDECLCNKSLSFWTTGKQAKKDSQEEQEGLNNEDNDVSFATEDPVNLIPINLNIHTECYIGHYECVREIVKKKLEPIDDKNRGGWTPLMYASYTGHFNIVNLLLEAGVNVNTCNDKKMTSLMLAASCGNDDVVRILVEQRAGINDVDCKGWTALYHATFSGHQNVVKCLLDFGADPEICEPINGMTPFMEAANAGHETIIQYFLSKGIDVRKKNKHKHSALTLAMFRGHSNIVSMINEHLRACQKAVESQKKVSIEDQKMQNALQEGPVEIRRLLQKMSTTSDDGEQQTMQKTTAAAVNFTAKNQQLQQQHLQQQQQHLQLSPQQEEHYFASSANDSFKLQHQQYNQPNNQQMQPTNQQQQFFNQQQQHYITTQQQQFQQTHQLFHQQQQQYSDLQQQQDSAYNMTLQYLLTSLGLAKYAPIFHAQDIDLPIFLTLTDADLKEIGINLLGPRKKMMLAINRWHSNNNNNNNNNDYFPTLTPPAALLQQPTTSTTTNIDNDSNKFSTKETELQNIIIGLHQKNQLLQQHLKREEQLRVAMETCLMKDRSQYQVSYLGQSEELVDRISQNMNRFKVQRESISAKWRDCMKRIHQKLPPISEALIISNNQSKTSVLKNIEADQSQLSTGNQSATSLVSDDQLDSEIYEPMKFCFVNLESLIDALENDLSAILKNCHLE